MILLLDNFDSFTYNLVDYFGQLGVECKVFRNTTPIEEIIQYKYDAIVLSPGPETPKKAGNLLQVLEFYENKLPILGICLGHQAIGEYFGAKLVKGEKPMHGKISEISADSTSILFKGLPQKFDVVRYHSLCLVDMPSTLKITAQTQDQTVMALEHGKLPICGLQFHPEAVLTAYGLEILKNWINTWS
ncbi:anthranilate synthase component II [Sediminitomix flava]|uniref:Anthranilate synthase component II n=1 Tax=Sediminitomix flava TaxID=379075 RepID=A0A315ZEV6_SEDFL|nr:aminodeoxychorismate/anthranilate synthase component II [Sediminitomix flava]PWJ44126.1 anthranilate synthase component II [Sediminitomix flava]